MKTEKRGFVTIATGNERYYIIAKNLLDSYRFHAGGYPFAIICDRENEYTAAFDKAVLMKNPSNSYMDKLRLFDHLPFDETIFIDADCLIYGDIDRWWDLFEQADDFSAFGRALEDLSTDQGWFRTEGMGKYRDQIHFVPNFSGGVYYLRNTERCAKVFEIAKEAAAHYREYPFAIFEDPADEPVIALGMAVTHCRPVNCGDVSLYSYKRLTRADISVPQAEWKYEGLWRPVIMIHWGHFGTMKAFYLSEVSKVRWLLQGKPSKGFAWTVLFRWKLLYGLLHVCDLVTLWKRIKRRIMLRLKRRRRHAVPKVLFFIEKLEGGGAEKVLRDLVNHMDQRRFDITVQTVWPCDASRYLAPGIRYKSMYPSDNKLNRILYRAEAESGLAYRLHIKDDYDIECAYLEMGSTKIMASSTNRRAKKLAWVHCDLMKAVANPQEFARRNTARYAKFDQIVCVSKGVKESFDTLFENRFPSVVLHNVIDDETIREKAGCEVPDFPPCDVPVVMAVGRLSAPKNFERLLKAHGRILREGVQHHLWIIGEGPERDGLERFVAEHGLKNTVHMPGFRDNPYAYMNRADIIVCSSSYEGFSTSVTEAVILGKPIVTTDCFGMQEILGESEYGLITENDDEAFYAGLKKMIADPELRQFYAAHASKRRESFSASALTETTERFLTAMMGESH